MTMCDVRCGYDVCIVQKPIYLTVHNWGLYRYFKSCFAPMATNYLRALDVCVLSNPTLNPQLQIATVQLIPSNLY